LSAALVGHGALVLAAVVARSRINPLPPLNFAAMNGVGGGADPGSTVKVPNLNEETLDSAMREIENAGFEYRGQTQSGYIRFRHADGSEIWIRDNGEVIRLGPKIQPSPNSKAYHPRFDYLGNPSSHNTGEFVIR
jgi:hypothetical protein